MEVVRFYLNYWNNINPKEAKRVKSLSALMIFLGVMAGIISTGLIGLINTAINSDTLTPTVMWSFAALVVLLPIAKFLSESTINWLFIPVSTDLMRNFMRKFMGLTIQEIEMHGSDKYYAVLNEDLRVIYNALRALVFIAMQGTILISCLVYLGYLSLPVLGITVLFVGGGLTLHRLILNHAQSYLAVGREEYGKLIKFFEAISLGIKEFKLHRNRRNAFFDKLVEPAFKKMDNNIITGHNIFNAGQSLTSILYFTLMGLLIFGCMVLFNVEREIMSGYALTVMFMLAPLESVVNNSNTVYRAKVSVRKMEEVGMNLFVQKNNDSFFGEQEPLQEWQEIKFEQVEHHYGPKGTEAAAHDFVLGPIDLSFHPGEVTIVAGGNGSGKTTLAKLIVGLYEPVAGHISYNGIPVTDENRDAYRQNFSAVFVDFYLFNRLLGFDHLPDLDGQAQRYLEELEISDKLNITNGELSTTDLSQGQRKRLALLITYLEDRPFYVFDEWTANQDPLFRDFFYREVVPSLKAKGKAVLIITHDDKYFDAGDRVIKMDMGKVEFDVPASSVKAMDIFELNRYTTVS